MRTITKIFLFFLATLSLLGGIYALAAWQSPTAGPPNNNTEAPLNISSDFQEKSGGLKLLYLILKPGEKPADTEGAMFYDTANKIFQCFQNDKWYNCLGYILPKVKADNSGFETDILEIINPLRTDKMARLANILGPVENNDAANKEFVVNYVDDKVGGSGSGSLSDIKQSWQMYNIYITPDTHDGDFGGWPGVDKFCQDQMNNKQCTGFSSDMISASYVGGSPLNFGTWDTNLDTKARYSRRYIGSDFYLKAENPNYQLSQSYGRGTYFTKDNCKGYTDNAPIGVTSTVSGDAIFSYRHSAELGKCINQIRFLCACPGVSVKRWKILPTAGTHDGKFGGVPGINKFCADQLGTGCRVFSNDIIHSAYYDGPKLNFAEWDTTTDEGWIGRYYITEESVEDNSVAGAKGAIGLGYDMSCSGWTLNNTIQGSVMQKNGAIINRACNLEKPVICACPEN